MKSQFIIWAFAGIFLLSCTQPNQNHQEKDEHEHEEVSVKYTAYSSDFELFAEADPFVKGDSAKILAHFTGLSNFKPLVNGKVKLRLTVDQKDYTEMQENPVRPGIYLFHLKPESAGTGSLQFEIDNGNGISMVLVPNIKVYDNEELAHEDIEKQTESKTNATAFTKEQSWKVDFQTALPEIGKFGQVIKATALVESIPSKEIIISALSSGFVAMNATGLTEGMEVKKNQSLLTVSGNNLTENNISLKFQEAKSRYELTKAEYDRANELYQDKIVSEKDFLAARNTYEIAKNQYDNLNKTVGKSGQSIQSPAAGFVRQIYVKNGSYVEAGEKLMVLTATDEVLLTAEVPQRFYAVLNLIQSAVIQSPTDTLAYSLEQLNGKVLSVGKAANTNTYQLPVNLQVSNPGGFLPGSFVEVYLKAAGTDSAMYVPESALIEEQGNFFVWVQLNPELFEKREVFPGASDGLFYEIKRGIAPKERIVTKGAMMIKLAQSTGALDAHSGHVH